jgi:ABC-type Fe3+/spermidine/putrescine transport system ATPase subunit
MVFQGYGLFPHMTVRQNVAYGLRIARAREAEIAARVDEMLELVHLREFAERPAPQLSGGQAQRVALARALIMRPKVLLLDEPLAALDLQLRRAMQEELRRIHRSLGGTFVFVTHDQEEAMGLANRIVVMQAGRIVQEGSPTDVYANPASRFVAGFVGEANLLPGRRSNGVVTLDVGLDFDAPGPDGAVAVMVRPQAIAIDDRGGGRAPGRASLPARVLDRIFLGDHVKYVLECAGTEFRALAPATTARQPDIGADITLSWPFAAQRVLPGGES